MYRLVVLVLIACISTSIWAIPTAPDGRWLNVAKRADIDPGRLDQLRRDYRGIYWDTAVEECSREQFDILTEALRKAVDEVFSLAGDRSERVTSSSLNRFFIRPFESGMTKHWLTDNELSIAFLKIMEAMENVEQFPKRGKRGRSPQRSTQIKFKCKPFPGQACDAGVLAKTHTPQQDEDQGWSIVFCDKFFDRLLKKNPPSDAIDFLNNLEGRGLKSVSSLPSLRSYEHVIIHELFHVDMASGMYGDDHITDYEAALPGFPKATMYGATLAHEFAWVATKPNTRLPYTSPNIFVRLNADNYAWYYTNLYFANRWGWTDDGRNLALNAEDAGFQESSTPSETVEIDLLNPPVLATTSNCYYLSNSSLETLDWYCPYKGQDGLSWLQELVQPFETDGGCQLTKECHLPAKGTRDVDPDCKCTCDNQDTSLADTRCAGYEGELVRSKVPSPSAPTLSESPKPTCRFDWCGSPICDPPCGP